MKLWTIGATAVALLALPGAAAAQRGWSPPECELSTGHYLVNSAVLYLRTAATSRFDDERQRQRRDAHRVLLQALDQGQADNAAVWYFLGRYYLDLNDIPGMDSAFDRATTLAPQCAADVRGRRRHLWVPLLNSAVDRIQAGDNEAAMAALQRANSVYADEPPGFYYLAQIFANRQEPDSAVRYYRQAMTIANDSLNRDDEQYRDLHADAMFNVASLYHMRQEHDSAISWYRRYRELRPTDPQALTRLAEALGDSDRGDEALALYDSVLARADSMNTLDLFQAGVALFRARRFARSAQAFEMGLQRNPHYRDALFNLANAYLSMANDADSTAGAATTKKELGAKMSPVARRLVEVDPHNKPARRLLAASYQLQDMPDTTLAVLEDADKMDFDVTVSRFTAAGSGFDVRGIIANLRDAPVEVPALVFEFVSAGGEVVQTITVDAQTVGGGEIAAFSLAPIGEGIQAWRYRSGT
jgi:tetratricopeptide (TPR) repeat protein